MPTNQPISAGARLGSMLLDHILMSSLAGVLGLVAIGIAFLLTGHLDWKEGGWFPWLVGFVFVIYLNKDWFGGRSPGKRLTGQRVVDVRNGLPADELRCFLRNVTIPAWPLEVVVTLVSRGRRLGDWLAGTQVVLVEPSEVAPPRPDVGGQRWGLKSWVTVVLSCGYVALLLIALQQAGWRGLS